MFFKFKLYWYQMNVSFQLYYYSIIYDLNQVKS